MSSRPIIYLICGVPGSGKTWVCLRHTDRFDYVAHDEFIGKDILSTLMRRGLTKPIITECPFGERPYRERLETAGFEVRPMFIVEPLNVVLFRYASSRGRELPLASQTRCKTILTRAMEWQAPHGTSDEIDALLRGIHA